MWEINGVEAMSVLLPRNPDKAENSRILTATDHVRLLAHATNLCHINMPPVLVDGLWCGPHEF